MRTPITITSPKNKFKVQIGYTDNSTREAVFFITSLRLFQEAKAVGVDECLFKRKSLQWSKYLVFKLWDGRKFVVNKDDFLARAWRYPPKDDSNYKAAPDEFEPKRVLTIEELAKIDLQPKTPEERSKRFMIQGGLL